MLHPYCNQKGPTRFGIHKWRHTVFLDPNFPNFPELRRKHAIITLISHPLHFLTRFDGQDHSQLVDTEEKSLMNYEVFASILATGRAVGPSRSHRGWYDLRNPACSKADARCFSHAMTERTCLQRLEAFNGNLTTSGGHALDAWVPKD